MPTPDEETAIFRNQLWTWAQAASRQRVRLLEATAAWDTEETGGERPEVNGAWMWTELAFFMFAVRNATRYAQDLAEAVDSSAIRDAVAACEADIAGAAGLRNWFEHLDEYLAGKGRSALPAPTFAAIEVLLPVEGCRPHAFQAAGVIVDPDRYDAAIRLMVDRILGAS